MKDLMWCELHYAYFYGPLTSSAHSGCRPAPEHREEALELLNLLATISSQVDSLQIQASWMREWVKSK